MSGFDPGRVITPVAVLLLIFSALVSGGTYPMAGSIFGFGAIVLALLSIGTPDTSWKSLAPAAPFLGVLYLSSFWTINLNNTLNQSFFVTTLVLFSFAASNGITGNRRRAVLTALFCAASIVAAYGVYQYYIGFPRTEEFLRESGAASGLTGPQIAEAAGKLRYRRAFSTMFSPNVMACYIAMVVPVGVDLLLSSRKGRLMYALLLAVMAFSLFLTKSAGGFVALVFALFVYSLSKFRGRFSGRNAAAAVLIIAVLTLMGAGIYLGRSDREMGVGNSVSKRIDYWHSALEMSGRSPLVGCGAGSFEILYPAYKKQGSDEVRYAHNLVLQSLAETGVTGAASLLLLFFMFAWKCLSRMKNGGDDSRFAPGILAGGAAFFVDGMFDFSFYIPETAALFFLFLGLAYARERVPDRPGKAWNASRAAALVAVLVFSFFFTKSYLASSYRDDALSVLAGKGVRSQTAARSAPPPPEALDLAQKAVRMTPYDDRAHAFLASLYEGQAARDGRLSADRAVGEYQKAIALNPYYPYHYRDLGILYMRLGDSGKAADNFRSALSRYPTSPILAEYLKLAGNK